MAIVVIVKSLKGLKCGGKKPSDRYVKIDFRGVSHCSSNLTDSKQLADDEDSIVRVNQSFTWNFGRAIQESETLQLAVVSRNVLRQEKILGRYGLVLQSVVRDGRVSITDALVDLNNRPISVIISFEIRYEAPDYEAGSDSWSSSYATTTSDMFQQQNNVEDERQMLIDIEENIANLERSLANKEAKANGGKGEVPEAANARASVGGKNAAGGIKSLVHQYQRNRSGGAAGRSSESGTSGRKISTMRTVKNLMRLGKQRPSRQSASDGGESSDCSETHRLIDSCGSANVSRRASNGSLDSNVSSDRGGADEDSCCSSVLGPGEDDDAWNEQTGNGNHDDAANRHPENPQHGSKHSGRRSATQMRPATDARSNCSLKAQHYQVCITIIEARQLAGLNMDPVVCVQIGDQRKYTSVKESTNCPYYNEYFVFDFHMPPVMLLDKIIVLSVQQSRNILRANLTLGSFKLDIATVWAQQDHQFYHKWALLTDPEDAAGGPKGYLKCDISVIGKGDSVKIPASVSTTRGVERDDDDIEGNLLLPATSGANVIERQRARFIVKIYRADGLPKMNSSVMASVKKAFTGGQVKDLVDPYVRVSFAGLSGKTSVKRNSYAPVWNEQIVFTEMFPPLCQRIKIQLRDDDPVNGSVIGTHFIDLKQISNDGERGFLPTFGPAFIHLYGSTRDYSLVDRHSTLNTGLGEGISYRARLLIAIRTEMSDNADVTTSGASGPAGNSDVSVTQTTPINENAYATNEEFFLFASIMDATMIDKKLGERPMYFEISIGNAGNTLDGHNESSKMKNGGVEQQMVNPKNSLFELSGGTSPSSLVDESWQSTTCNAKPMTHDRLYYFMPYWDDKPCLYVRSVWPDYRRRMYNSNVIGKIVEKLEEGLSEVETHEDDPTRGEKILKSVLEELCTGCTKYVGLSKSSATGGGSGLGKTKLDKERIKLCQRELEHIGSTARNLKVVTTKNSFKESFKTARTFLDKLKFLLEDPQQSLPDIFIWVISSGKRVAYHRMPARDVVYSIVDEESGRFCSTVQSVYLKLPEKKGFSTSGWSVQAKLQVYVWLGISRHKRYLLQGLPKGYEMNNELKNLLEKPRAPPPLSVHYVEKHKFQLRAHMYQARSLIGSDASGLSDPFARVICGEFHKTTQVIDETLSPTWDELLIIDNIIIYSTGSVIKKDPPTVVIELFDRDKVGKSEYIGRTIARARVKLASDPYAPPEFPPSLEWYRVTRGSEPAGELLAVFELLEYEESSALEPRLPEPKLYRQASAAAGSEITISELIDEGPIFPVPCGIRPTLSRYRIEVLFWGLRDLRRIHLLSVDRPRVDVECAGHILHSSVIQNAKKNPNFSTPIKYMDLELPDQELYRPPVTIRTIDCRSFGRYTLVGTHTISSIQRYMHQNALHHAKISPERRSTLESTGATIITLGLLPPLNGKITPEMSNKRDKMRSNFQRKKSSSAAESLSCWLGDSSSDEHETSDWWTKYFASIEAMMSENERGIDAPGAPPVTASTVSSSIGGRLFNHSVNQISGNKKNCNANASAGQASETKRIATMKIYRNELESQPEFQHFREWLDTFELYRGKNSGAGDQDAASRVVGSFKGALRVYKQQRWPSGALSESGSDEPQFSFFQSLPIPSNEPIRVLVRVYIVRANDLHPCDPNGKADPYVVLQLGDKVVSDKNNYSSKQLNLVLGKCFEIEATLPQDSLLIVKVVDWDLVGPDDVIGETRIDLENRYYSKHRATCGLARQYDESGYNKWRDPMKPTQILSKLCKDGKLDPPSYSHGRVIIGKQIFTLSNEEMMYYGGDNACKGIEEHLALAVLNRWNTNLVPEHVESRPLYNPDKPGIEQGRLDMWVDMFPMDMPLPGPPIDISPRKPKGYELRIIIWNTEDVVLEDDAFFTGEKMSDIYVKGWLKGSEDCQSTDIHYRSLTGEGNFNWRFIYPFDYLVAEERIVIRRKESLFSWDETEFKIPARLELQVWDADHFSADDFLGAITLNLNRFPRGAKTSKLCTLNMLKTDGSVPAVNIFKQKRVRGWWPFYVKKQNEDMELTGKVEAEIHLLTKEEAESKPAGPGRSEPDPLDKPSRPDASFVWLLNPIKSIRYIIWHNYKWIILKILITIAIATLLILFLYAIPGYSVKKILGA
ncbi:otoferlin-like [Venturia canescens]|uniref:otoferlin-like n=1 Tax=Venturia canescens TaxID=32260 RepID=UPI001C9CA9F8|nr:otoferlin-like [Venturia canescens]